MQSGQTKYGIGMTVSACLWLGLFPLLQFGSYRNLTRDKWICMLILAGVTLLCFLADVLLRRISRPRLLPLLFGIGLLGWTVLSCLLSPYLGPPWWIGTGRREGLATQLCYLGLFLLFSCSRVRRGPVLAAAGCGVLAFLAVIVLQLTVHNPVGLYPEGYDFESAPHFQGTVGNVDICSAYLVLLCGLFLSALTDALRNLRAAPAEALRNSLTAPADNLQSPLKTSTDDSRSESADLFQPARHAKTRRLLGAAALFAVLAVSVWLLVTIHVASGLLALAVLAVWTVIRLLPKKARLPVLILLLAAVLLLAWCWPGQGGELWELHELLHLRPQFAFGSGRVGVWIRTYNMLREDSRLLLGTGADTYARRFNDFLKRYELAHPDKELLLDYYDSPHCEYLAMAVNCGLPAVFCFLVLIIMGSFGIPPWRDGVLAYAVQAALSFSVCIVAPIFWVLLGLSLTRREPAA